MHWHGTKIQSFLAHVSLWQTHNTLDKTLGASLWNRACFGPRANTDATVNQIVLHITLSYYYFSYYHYFAATKTLIKGMYNFMLHNFCRLVYINHRQKNCRRLYIEIQDNAISTLKYIVRWYNQGCFYIQYNSGLEEENKYIV